MQNKLPQLDIDTGDLDPFDPSDLSLETAIQRVKKEGLKVIKEY